MTSLHESDPHSTAASRRELYWRSKPSVLGGTRALRVREIAVFNDIFSPGADLTRLWSELCSGQMRFRDVFHSNERCYGLLERRALTPDGEELDEPSSSILERVLVGQSQKAVAIDLGLAPSTISAKKARCLEWMGSGCRTSGAPILLVMAAYAARGLGRVSDARLARVSANGGETWVLSAPRPDLHVAAGLSRSEAAILAKIVEGESVIEIVRSRQTSKRTIANQLGSLFRKMGVSGRAALLGELVARACASKELS